MFTVRRLYLKNIIIIFVCKRFLFQMPLVKCKGLWCAFFSDKAFFINNFFLLLFLDFANYCLFGNGGRISFLYAGFSHWHCPVLRSSYFPRPCSFLVLIFSASLFFPSSYIFSVLFHLHIWLTHSYRVRYWYRVFKSIPRYCWSEWSRTHSYRQHHL